ncbi:MAG: FkbM family methyltransferase [Bacteroidales bacterium]|jgi:FkbM family methyltransferase|nr:FkbM family methyltransferase [Bacteroidales bacterium]
MKTIRRILYKILGLEKYLKLVSFTFIRYIKSGFGKSKHAELHYLKKIIKDGFVCIDIGANLGYYSYFLTKYCGEKGKVYAVEPISLHVKILKKNVRGKNFQVFPYALGAENTTVEMGMPKIDGIIHHGMTKIVHENQNSYEKVFNAEMKIPDELFGNLGKIDFIKVDIEGYESVVFSNMLQVLKKYKPLIQSELSGSKNRIDVINLLSGIGYKAYILENIFLVEIKKEDVQKYETDFYFVCSQ